MTMKTEDVYGFAPFLPDDWYAAIANKCNEYAIPLDRVYVRVERKGGLNGTMMVGKIGIADFSEEKVVELAKGGGDFIIQARATKGTTGIIAQRTITIDERAYPSPKPEPAPSAFPQVPQRIDPPQPIQQVPVMGGFNQDMTQLLLERIKSMQPVDPFSALESAVRGFKMIEELKAQAKPAAPALTAEDVQKIVATTMEQAREETRREMISADTGTWVRDLVHEVAREVLPGARELIRAIAQNRAAAQAAPVQAAAQAQPEPQSQPVAPEPTVQDRIDAAYRQIGQLIAPGAAVGSLPATYGEVLADHLRTLGDEAVGLAFMMSPHEHAEQLARVEPSFSTRLDWVKEVFQAALDDLQPSSPDVVATIGTQTEAGAS